MNNDLEQFSEERLEDMQKHVAAGMALGYADALLIRRVIDIALAAKQAKPVGYIAEVSGNRVGVLRGLPMPEIGSFIYTTPQPANAEQVPDMLGFDPALAGSEATVITNYFTPDGWKMVPEEATIAMLTLLGMTGSFEFMQRKYKNMLAAAPKPESE